MMTFLVRLGALRRKIKPRTRLTEWRIRLTFGMVLLVLSELVVWQNPPRRTGFDWVALYILYTALGAIFLDLVVRFQVATPAALGLASGVYGLAASSLINHTAYENIPFGLLSRGMGLQVGAGFLALMFFLIVMRGKAPEPLPIASAGVVGVAWALWGHWYPLQATVGWGLATMETLQLYTVIGLMILAILFSTLPPRFGTLRETRFTLLWWEGILVGVPLFISVLVGMINGAIPALIFLIPVVLVAYCLWALRWQKDRRGYEPSILAELTYIAPNLITYVIMAGMFLFAGGVAYPLVEGKDAPLGVVIYYTVVGFGTAWLPFASGLIFWEVLRTDLNPRLVTEAADEDEEGES
ncbi:MAG TPA: hypothetical protein PLD47_13135 [Aggregatilineales bacterium]|nr:hypothetical protein [Anaerolineales bacterium]HRE48662.1 hypothetical protein [Aggregatilineales bacterium]